MPSVVFIIGIGLILVGCATPYQPKGFRGGYEEVEVKPGVYFLTFEGNRHTSLSTAATYWHQRAKELCAQRGEVADVLNATAANEIAGAVGYSPSLMSGGIGSINIIRKPAHSGYIRCVSPSSGPEQSR